MNYDVTIFTSSVFVLDQAYTVKGIKKWPVEKIKDVVELCDMVLVMSVFPGFGGQKFIPTALDKLRELRAMIDKSGREIDLQIDGGVTAENVAEIKEAGANVIVAGSAVFKAADRAAMIAQLKA